MNMMDAVKSVYSKYATFSGRARRAEYWWFYLFYLIVYLLLGIVDSFVFGTTTSTDGGFSATTETPILSGIFALATLLPILAVGARRLHDIDRSGWWLLIGLVPLVGVILLIVWFAKAGDTGPNRFGADPITGDGAGPGEADYAETSIPKV
ncbi:DUF805 domain-containing protein [Maritimibacter sp. UBA3975]|uniref:DUF805 domain-containing protein n=1 Tax=Maritimibacter sp. UBA3975 TaxID=1946833 RepID=UPI000C0A8F89|nr:DUF805 domain-containing protein [Maritimibacter sp. UBA3975]MAM62120.1 DUF805 domain-containing protein [Maritimibacter sp.]|tara:strand:- start:10591 stop:11043 length:453 start_codon:yes stop_codon:yes gene_type:complete